MGWFFFFLVNIFFSVVHHFIFFLGRLRKQLLILINTLCSFSLLTGNLVLTASNVICIDCIFRSIIHLDKFWCMMRLIPPTP